jgi:Ras-related protein Rab-28
MITNYIAGADAVLLCYDITNYESFANLEDWYRLVLRTFYGEKMPYVALLGNKSECSSLADVFYVPLWF